MIISAMCNIVKERKNSVIGYASVLLEDPKVDFKFTIKGIQIMEIQDGIRFITFPARKDSKAEDGYADICFPLNQETRNMITKTVLDEFERKYGKTEIY